MGVGLICPYNARKGRSLIPEQIIAVKPTVLVKEPGRLQDERVIPISREMIRNLPLTQSNI